MERVELSVYVEEKFGVRFGDREALDVETVYDLVLLSHQYYSEKKNKHMLAKIQEEKNLRQKNFRL